MKETQWEKDLAECGDLHSKDCLVNTEDGCDCDTGIVDCCENMQYIANLVRTEKEKENQRWIELAKAHRPYCTKCGNKDLTRMMGKKNRNLN